MKKTLERIYIAVDLDGNEFIIENIAEYILSIGIRKYVNSFGFDFGKISKKVIYIEKEKYFFDYDNYDDNFYQKTVLESEFKYRIKDYFGKFYCPQFILSELLNNYDIDTSYYYSNEKIRFGYKSYIKKYSKSKYRMIKFNKGFWQANENCKDYNVKKLRNLKNYFDVPYDDYIFRDEHKNWKKYRKTQYKLKKS